MTALADVAAAPGRARGGEGARRRPVGAVRVWLFALAALVVAMVAVGGATRLTGSGLSITEWRPVTGAVPPLSQEAWEAEFVKYRESPQYELLNRGMGLDAFKIIYAWEWGHRQLGRLIALAFFGPLVWFWRRGLLGSRLALTLLALGALGGLQGAVGWIMGPRIRYGADAQQRILAEWARTPQREPDGTATWSLSLLQKALRKAPDGLPRVSTYTIWRTLHEAGLSWQKSRTWCETGVAMRQRKHGVVRVRDPDALAKKS